jgi:hypothetical protein
LWLTRDEAIAANIAELRSYYADGTIFSALIYINASHKRLHVCTALSAPSEL